MIDKRSLEALGELKKLHAQAPTSIMKGINKHSAMKELMDEIEFSLNAASDPLPNQGAFMAEHLQKLIAAIESEKPDENLTRSVSEAKAALGLYQVTL